MSRFLLIGNNEKIEQHILSIKGTLLAGMMA